MLLGKNIDNIDEKTLQSLIDAGATESTYLEFKRQTYGTADKDKKEFLKDISCFANTLGGHLIIGMDANKGAASALMPIPKLDADEELQRLESIEKTGIEPALVGFRTKRVDVNDGSLIVMHVPRSVNPPHRVIYKNNNRYYGRSSTRVYELSLEELRAHFGERRSIEERAKSFVGERFLRIQGNDGVMPIPVEKGVLIMHLVPLPDFKRRHEIEALLAQSEHFTPIFNSMSDSKINLDGYCIYKSFENPCDDYTQIFHNGSIEATSVGFFEKSTLFFDHDTLPLKLINALNRYMKGLRAIDATAPVLLQISMMNVKGLKIPNKTLIERGMHPPYGREDLHLPSSVITEFQDDNEYESVIAEQMHFLWNAFNFPRCKHFDENEKYCPRNSR